MVVKTVIGASWLALWLFVAGDPFTGFWKLNLSKSKLPPPLPQSQTTRIEANAGGIDIVEEIVSDKGERTTVTVSAKFDGKDYPVNGSPVADSVVYQRIDSHTIRGVARKAGKVVVHETVVVSKDGKTLTGTYSGTDAAGKEIAGIAVFEKQ